MRLFAAAIDLVVGLGLAWLATIGISLDTIPRAMALVVAGLMLLAGAGLAMNAPWGARLGQALGWLGLGLGVLTVVGGIAAFMQGGDFSDLAGAVLLALGATLSISFGLALIVNRRAAAAD
ncbi:MAG: hypothetical protein M3P32_04045 [Chloroflexota bacterium]|nr:hypothetical protein [Chloroflexota bacterium]